MLDLHVAEATVDDFEGWLWNNLWSVYKFHYRYYAPFRGPEIISIKNSLVSFARVDLFICYLFLNETNVNSEMPVIEIDEDVILLNLSTKNSGHSLDEAVSFVNFYLKNNINIRVGVNSFILESLPHVYALIKNFIDERNIIVLNGDNIYRIKNCILRRNTHYNYVRNWKEIPYTKVGNEIRIDANERPELEFAESPELLHELSRKMGSTYNFPSNAPSVVMLCKTSQENLAATPSRAMQLSEQHAARLTSAGIHMLSPSSVSSFTEYVATLSRCKTFITSYGAAACTNRFFVPFDAKVIVLANQHYESEYAEATIPEYRHLRQTHLFPVSEQTFILDHVDIFDDTAVENLIRISTK